MRGLPVLLAVLLAGCAAQDAHDARMGMAGRSWDDTLSCMGGPNGGIARRDDGGFVATWDYSQAGASTAVPLSAASEFLALPAAELAGSIGISTSGDCWAIATVRHGAVTGFQYSGASGGLSGRDAVCLYRVRGCLRHWRGEQ